jgi:hypothetical protein
VLSRPVEAATGIIRAPSPVKTTSHLLAATMWSGMWQLRHGSSAMTFVIPL